MRETSLQTSVSDVEEPDNGEDEWDRFSAEVIDDLDPIAGLVVRDESAGGNAR